MTKEIEKKGKVGRPALPVDQVRTDVIQIRLTRNEKKALMNEAKKSAGGTVAFLVREKIINAGSADAWNKPDE